MLKEELFSANKAETLPHAKVYNESDKSKCNLQLNGYPCSSYIQFLTIPWEEIWKIGKDVWFSDYILCKVQTIGQFSEQNTNTSSLVKSRLKMNPQLPASAERLLVVCLW